MYGGSGRGGLGVGVVEVVQVEVYGGGGRGGLSIRGGGFAPVVEGSYFRDIGDYANTSENSIIYSLN